MVKTLRNYAIVKYINIFFLLLETHILQFSVNKELLHFVSFGSLFCTFFLFCYDLTTNMLR